MLRSSAQALDWAALLCLVLILSACGGQAVTTGNATAPTLNPLDSAAAEATAIVQQARATAMVLQAQTQATALVQQALTPATDLPRATTIAYVASSPTARPLVAAGPAITSGTATPPGTAVVEILSVSLAAEGGMVMVQFRAPPAEAEKWWPGNVSVEDEASGDLYDEIPVMPKIGPLIGRPKVDGQLGYVMLVNEAPGLGPGAVVTVVLGAYHFEHVRVQ